jgi:hypothetical protein
MPGSDPFLDFVGVAAPRSGTTWIAAALREHPEIWMPAAKELNFFNEPSLNHLEFKYPRGLDYYREQFSGAPRDDLVSGEFSPTYYVDPNTASRIAKHFPDARILVYLRNPVDVVYSTYLKTLEYGLGEKSFELALERTPSLVELGHYYQGLRPYFELFPREQIFAQIFETLFESPGAACKSVYRFLGVDPSFRPRVLHRKVNPRGTVRSRGLVAVQHHARHLMNRPTLLPLKRMLNRNGALDRMREGLIRLNRKKADLPELDPDMRQRLEERYSADIDKLEGLLGQSLDVWRKGQKPAAS